MEQFDISSSGAGEYGRRQPLPTLPGKPENPFALDQNE